MDHSPVPDSQLMSVAYLEKLNPEQRRAVEPGVRDAAAPGTPLLVIAGAGSGKTNTLAHRVAHLIVNGADPRKILLMTFSRRAAAEMARRVERIARRVTPIERVSFPMDCSAFSSGRHGRWRRLDRPYGRRAKACASISALACAACGDKEDGPLCNLYSVTKAGCLIAAGGHYRTLMWGKTVSSSIGR